MVTNKFLYYGGSANLEHVNPNFDPSGLTGPYNINCVSCAIATDVSLGGILVRAVPCAVEDDIILIQKFYGREFRDILRPEDIRGKDQSTVTEILSRKMNEIRSELTRSGEKSRFIIYVKTIRPDGHVFNAWNKGEGIIQLLDGQKNEFVTNFQSSIGIISLLQTGFTNQE
jgi:Papain fold toxin 1, glutamine deamidase